MNSKQTHLLFYSASIFNFLAAAVLLAASGIAMRLGLHPPPTGGPYEAVMVAAIVVFGVGYAWAAHKPAENRAIIKLGLLGKLSVVAVIYGYAFAGVANIALAMLASGDLLYSILFSLYLYQSR